MISTIIITTVVSLIMGMLYVASQGKAKEDNQGNLILQLPKFYWFLGIIMILIGVGLLVVANFYVDTPEDKKVVFSMCIVATVLGCYLFLKGYISKIIVTNRGVIAIGLFGQQTPIHWNEITTISFGSISQELSIRSKQNTIRAHIHLVGFNELVSKLEEKTGKPRNEMGLNSE